MTYERRIALLSLAACVPSLVTALAFVAASDLRLRFKFAVAGALLALTLLLLDLLRERASYPLHSLSNIAASIREHEFSLRARPAGDGALDDLGRELNALSTLLREQRLDDVEAGALVRAIVARVDAAIFAFDADGRVQLVNPAGERLLGVASERILGRREEELSLPAPGGRWAIRRSTFREKGETHALVVIADVGRELRAEELLAWQRLVRVLTHELHNSLAPIKAIASSLAQTIEGEEARHGLAIIASRADALTRFTQAYARLARLPTPRLAPVDVDDVVTRVRGLTRVPVGVERGPKTTVIADADQLEQALINLLQNAIDAAAETGGGVAITWTVSREAVELLVRDEGPGLSGSANLFVPFFTTKPDGTGIGLVLSRQIAEAHGGTLTLHNRSDRTGCEARLTLPMR